MELDRDPVAVAPICQASLQLVRQAALTETDHCHRNRRRRP